MTTLALIHGAACPAIEVASSSRFLTPAESVL